MYLYYRALRHVDVECRCRDIGSCRSVCRVATLGEIFDILCRNFRRRYLKNNYFKLLQNLCAWGPQWELCPQKNSSDSDKRFSSY